ncbi:amidase [Pseudomonas sp. N040]|uniref:amidase n=1 Tax=Pseudomonas sp. N040 TaxID=2785325 RepID=UPI0018A268BD|nr:amidase [Pseudomonas sp. N040]MBF7729602.1 amidase [Pseudomonas sp. N040]MBW7013242.1 amidase [Pseudomonas sp. N040]
MKRHHLLTLLIIILVLLFGLAWPNRAHLAAFPDIISAYTAKEYCSCRYVMDNPADYCVSYAKQYVPLSGFFDDQAHKRVTASGLGRSNTAAWLGPREGCRLLDQADALPQ